MSKKLTIDFIREQFEKEGYTLLTEKYINSKSYLEYICPKGHAGKIIWNSWQQEHRCKVCGINLTANKRRLTIGFVREEFKKEGYTLLTTRYINTKQSLRFICPVGHIYRIKWREWSQGRRCAICSGNIKLTLDFIDEQFKKEDYILLTKNYINCEQKLQFVCARGHKNRISWHDWTSGKRCRDCHLENSRGSSSPHWKSNLTDEDRQKRRSIPGYENWVYIVKERDNFTCQVCGNDIGGNLVSHHLESYNNNKELRTELSNGITLCEKCHKDFHHQYGWGNNTRKQFEEFSGIVIASI